MVRRLLVLTSNSLIVGGIAIMVLTISLFGYSQFEQYQETREVASLQPDVPDAWTPVSAPTSVPAVIVPTSAAATPIPQSTSTVPVATPSVPAATPTSIPTATAVPIYPPERIVASDIGLDSRVVEAPVVNGVWTVPKFVAGHLQGTANPLQGGNVVLSGHVESISSGNVFAKIGDLKPGDIVRLYTKATVVTYKVSQRLVVANNDVSVVNPTPTETLTLITCTGTWLPLQRDYSERTVVVATREQ